METSERDVPSYQTAGGVCPFREWRNGISDDHTRAAIDARVARFRGGNLGRSDPVGEGVSENKIYFGPGYRIYYGTDGNQIVLLCAGDKSTQDADIKRAKDYWRDYKKREKERKAAEKEMGEKNAKLQRRPRKRPKN